MRALITGGTGLIGTALIKKLRNQYRITVLTRDSVKAYKKLGHDIDTLNDLSSLSSLDSFDAVINLAGEPIADKRWTDKQKERIEQSRWQITEQLAQLCQASEEPPEVLISGSAIGYYGRQGEEPVTEAEPRVHDEFTHRLCAHWEQLALTAESEKTRVCLLRTGLVMAPSGGALARMSLPFKLGMGGPIGHGKQMMSWIHLDDIVDLIIFLLNNEKCSGPYNATAPHPVSNEEFSKTLGKVLHRPVFLRVPAFVMKGLLGEMADMLLTGQAVLPQRAQEAGFQFRHAQLREALQHCF
ncbi:TIGR01777 family protein [Aliidiomarina minuta]|uniref:TIGR01777 family protein n=1 Tax=Aliidiomarina minuta TaxID=880057 RepID=A0A432W7S0_9GAMM|nr:TIGR01777 family oxidoreductase [Aliidiomarina minuta]RUO26143.1 TIGR01777 family protein [Aliidiomarina minuta]